MLNSVRVAFVQTLVLLLDCLDPPNTQESARRITTPNQAPSEGHLALPNTSSLNSRLKYTRTADGPGEAPPDPSRLPFAGMFDVWFFSLEFFFTLILSLLYLQVSFLVAFLKRSGIHALAPRHPHPPLFSSSPFFLSLTSLSHSQFSLSLHTSFVHLTVTGEELSEAYWLSLLHSYTIAMKEDVFKTYSRMGGVLTDGVHYARMLAGEFFS